MGQAKEVLASTESEWQRLAPRIGVSDPKALAIYRQRYGEGIVRRSIAEEEPMRARSMACWPRSAVPELVGPGRELDRGTFYRPGG